ncbi:MAG: phage terminase large subunit [Endomicrobium sp.]|jgi:predicted phage terminase large subunit-like protein|nr:phage terminase large subunit [Endomicrobium sp.]
MNERILQSFLRSDFKSFVLKVFREVDGVNEYLDNWHVNVICYEIEQLIKGTQNKLIINIPPRYMKSIICSIALPAFILGHDPKAKIVCVSYSDDLAANFALDCRRIIESQWYQEIFPVTRLSKHKKEVSDFQTTKGGGRFSTSVGGTLTGMGGDIIIVDDPIAPKDANSDTIREKVNDWYGNTLISRLNNKKTGKILVIMQRSHEMDFTGHLQEIDLSFKTIKIPIIAEEDETFEIKNPLGRKIIYKRKVGDVLHPEREDIVKLNETKSSMGSYNFAGQYQQNPTSRGGNVIKREWLKFYKFKDLENNVWGRLGGCRICQSWDTASKIEQHNDYSVCITYLAAYDSMECRGKIYILDVFREKLEFPALVKKAIQLKEEMTIKYKCFAQVVSRIIIEDTNSGIGLVQNLRTKYHNFVIPVKPENDKATRLKNISHLIENGTVLFPEHKPEWWLSFEKEIITFPNGKHDDQCDSLSQLLTHEVTTNRVWFRNIY